MRALTVRQPYASAILQGVKDVENRSFFTAAGDILICAGQTAEPGGEHLPRGVALCIARIVGMIYTLRDGQIALHSLELEDGAAIETESYIPGSIGWLLRDIRPVNPIPVRGLPGIFQVEDRLIQRI